MSRRYDVVAYCEALPLMWKAYQKVRRAVLAGDIPAARTLTCVDCGKPAWCYDHRDYSKPLEVEPVCRKCNARRGPGRPYLDAINALS